MLWWRQYEWCRRQLLCYPTERAHAPHASPHRMLALPTNMPWFQGSLCNESTAMVTIDHQLLSHHTTAAKLCSIVLAIYLSHSLGDHWGTTRPGNQHSPFLSFLCSPHGVAQFQSQMLSSHRFLRLPLLFPPCTVPWRTVLASPEALVWHTHTTSFCVFLRWTRVLCRV